MLKRVFPDRQTKSANRNSSYNHNSQSPVSSTTDGNFQQSTPKGSLQKSDTITSTQNSANDTFSSSANSSPLKSSVQTTRLSSSSSSSPVKSDALISGGECFGGRPTSLSKLKTISRSCSSTEFQSLKLESMSTVEDFKSVSKTISSTLERDGMLPKQSSSGTSASGNDHESVSFSTPSDEEAENDPAESLFKHQAKFFCQMKEYLLSQQSSLRQHLEVLNALRKKKVTRRQRFLTSGHSVLIPAKPKSDVSAEICGNNHDIDLMNEFHSCSSTEKSDEDIQVCPLCGVEIEDSENPVALEEHVASHWCSPDDPI